MSGPSGKNKAPGFILRGLSPEQLAEVDRAAREAGKTRSEWARERLVEAAREAPKVVEPLGTTLAHVPR